MGQGWEKVQSTTTQYVLVVSISETASGSARGLRWMDAFCWLIDSLIDKLRQPRQLLGCERLSARMHL